MTIRADGMIQLYDGIRLIRKDRSMEIRVNNPAPWQMYSPNVWEEIDHA